MLKFVLFNVIKISSFSFITVQIEDKILGYFGSVDNAPLYGIFLRIQSLNSTVSLGTSWNFLPFMLQTCLRYLEAFFSFLIVAMTSSSAPRLATP